MSFCVRLVLTTLLLLNFVTALFAQLQVKLSQERTVYLLYEPMVFTLSITNISDESIALSREPGRSHDWLNFMIFNSLKEKVHQDEDFSVPSSTLDPGKTLNVPVNITPYYALRSTGAYSIQAVVNLPGRQPVQTSELYFSVGKGDVLWKKELFEQGSKRVYSLIRFLENHDSNLYLRVEDPNENIIYTTIRLGKMTAYTDPLVEFDKDRNIHIVHTAGAKTCRYTKADNKGKILQQQDRMVGTTRPILVRTGDGGVEFVGGVEPREKKTRPTLSQGQQGLM